MLWRVVTSVGGGKEELTDHPPFLVFDFELFIGAYCVLFIAGSTNPSMTSLVCSGNLRNSCIIPL